MLPDFAASSTSRPDTQETAAYAASQPLFDVLRGAISRLDDQKVHLTGAKDTVQHIHVKIPQEHIENNGTLPADYKDALIAAWKSTTESYVRIFEQLCELTGPDPAAGRQAEASYTGFQKLLYTAEAARTVAFEQDEEITQAKRTAEGSSESESTDSPNSPKATTPNKKAKRKAEESNERESSASVKTTTPNKKAKQTPTEVAATKRTAEPSPSQAVQRPVKRQRTIEEASTPEEKPTSQAGQTSEPATINTVQRLKPKQVRKERKRRNQQRQQEEVPQQATMPPPPTVPEPQKQQPVPEAQYQDVNAEVDARLRAKEEAKRAKKEAKKRKRDSAASHIIEAEPGAEREATEAKAKALAQKPAKKRSKSENGEAVRADAAKSQLQKGKRGNEEANGQAAEEDAVGARRSKRTKTKK